jgi:hypothetical protein
MSDDHRCFFRPRNDDRFDEILYILGRIMSALDDLKAEVAATITVEESAVTLIQGIATELAAALANAANPDPAIVDLTAQLTTSAAALAAAVAANTPAAPAPTP